MIGVEASEDHISIYTGMGTFQALEVEAEGLMVLGVSHSTTAN
jgi:hypothetical protein